MSITIDDVLDFVWTASGSDLSEIADAMMDSGYEYECYECEVHECEECDCADEVNEEKEIFIRYLAQRLNQFGFDDMLSELEVEASGFGVYINLRALA